MSSVWSGEEGPEPRRLLPAGLESLVGRLPHGLCSELGKLEGWPPVQEVSSFPAEALACSLHLIPALNGVCPFCFYPSFLKLFPPACTGSQQTPPPNSCLLLQPTSLASTSSIPFSGYPAGCPPPHRPAPP